MYDRRTLVIGAAGTGLRSWNLHGSYQIAGIRVDNPSGSWILLSDGTFVPPYTLDFGHSFQPMLAQIDVLWANGPAGQVTTQQGDNATVVIYSEPVGESPGVPSGLGKGFVEQFTPTILANAGGNCLFSTGIVSNTLRAAVVNKRWRMFALTVSLTSGLSIPPPLLAPSGFNYAIEGEPSFSVYIQGHVGPPPISYVDKFTFSPGVDFAVGDEITFSISPDWTDVEFRFSALLQLI